MDLKSIKSQIFHESVARRVFFRIFLFASAISIIPIVHILTTYDFKNFHLPKSRGCYAPATGPPTPQLPRGSYLFQGHFLNPVWDSFDSVHCQENVNLTLTIINEHLFNHSAKLLYVGGSSPSVAAALRDSGFSGAVAIDHGRFTKEFGYKLEFANCSFDFVLFRGRLKVSAADLVAPEVERVLRGGGAAAVVSGDRAEKLIGSAARISTVLRSSCVVSSGYLNKFYVTVLKKEAGSYGCSGEFRRRPVDCSAVAGNGTVVEKMKHV